MRATASDEAVELLCRRYLPRLRRWARGRLPAAVRGAFDTEDLVQDSFIKVLRNLKGLRPGAQWSVPRLRRGEPSETASSTTTGEPGVLPARCPSATAWTRQPRHWSGYSGRERIAKYEEALEQLSAKDRDLVFSRFEIGLKHAGDRDRLRLREPRRCAHGGQASLRQARGHHVQGELADPCISE